MHVVACTDSRGVGGAEISLANLVAEVDPGVRVDVLGVDDTVVGRVAAGRSGTRAIVAPAARHPVLLARLRPDVVHANLAVPWSSPVDLAAALALPRSRVVAVQQLPLRTVELPVWLRTRALLHRLDGHVAVGEASCRRIEDFYGLGRGSVVSIPNCVPDVALPPRPGAAAGAPLVVGSLGRLDAVKGYDLLLRALPELPDVRAVVIGEEPPGRTGAVGPGAGRGGARRAARLVGPAGRAARVRRVLPAVAFGGLPAVDRRGDAGRHCRSSRRGSGASPSWWSTGRRGSWSSATTSTAWSRRSAACATARCGRTRRGRAGRARERYTVEHMARAYERLWARVVAAPRTPRLRPPAPRP